MLSKIKSVKVVDFEKLFFPLCALAPFCFFIYFFMQFFPNNQGEIGHDYALFFPWLVSHAYWLEQNGWFSLRWFSPHTAAGTLVFANANSAFYSLPTFLIQIFNPLQVVKITFGLFAGLGYLGFYKLLRKRFFVVSGIALLGAVLFLFNNFYTSRLLIGHFTYYSFMLAPWFLLALLPTGQVNLKQITELFKGKLFARLNTDYCKSISVLGFILAYLFYAGAVHLVIPFVLMGIGGYCLQGKQPLAVLWPRLLGGMLFALLLTAPLLISTNYLMHTFPRMDYNLPGFSSLLKEVASVLRLLFYHPDMQAVNAALVNKPWFSLRQHEFAFSVSWAPCLMLVSAAIIWGKRMLQGDDYEEKWQEAGKKIKTQEAKLWLLAAVVLIPIIFNYYNVYWNSVLKNMPLIKSSSLLFRWYCMYIPLVIIGAILAFNSLQIKRGYFLILFGLGLIPILQNGLANWSYYQSQYYDPAPMVQAYEQFKHNKVVQPIEALGIKNLYETAQGVHQLSRNQLLVTGMSSLQPYEPIFGYRLESFPHKKLQPGSIYTLSSSGFNMINPACYLFPKENNCKPGDLFQSNQEKQLQAFANYKPYPFSKPLSVTISLMLAGCAWILLLGYWGMLLVNFTVAWWRKREAVFSSDTV